MQSSGLTPAEQRRLRRRRWIERRAVDRHPVSLTRHRTGIAALVLIMLGAAWYTATTRDRAIQRRAVDFLSEVTGCEVHVGDARFSMFGGIILRDVRISTPYNPELDASAIEPGDRQIVSARTIRLIHNPWLLLLGRLRVEEIVAVEPRIRLLQNVDTGLHNWQFIGRADKTPAASGSAYRPQIRIRSAKAIVASIARDGPVAPREEELDADVRPHPTSETGYCIEVRRFSDPSERATVVFDPGARTVTNAPFVDARTVRLQLPKAAQQLFEQIELRGEVKLTRLFYDPTVASERDFEIALRNVRCRIPLSMLRSGVASTQPEASAPGPKDVAPHEPGESAVTMTGVQGRLEWRANRIQLDVAGLVNDATCQLEGTLDAADRSLAQMGFDVRLMAAALPAPEGAVRNELLNDPSVPFVLRSIFADYDPHGVFDVDLQLKRAPGEQAELDLHGVLKPLGVRASSAWFPYAVTDLTGAIRFEGPIVKIENLRGRHGPADLHFFGEVDQRTFWSHVAVDIRGSNVPLDGELFDAMSKHHQDAWRRIQPRGTVDLDVKLRRAADQESEPMPPWRTRVEASPVHCAFSLGNKYEITDVCGQLSIEDDLAEIHALTGRRGDAFVQLRGRTAFQPGGRPESELFVQAVNVPLDDSLASILPPEGRGAFAQFQPSGFVDVSGMLILRNAEPTALYDVQLTVNDALVCYKAFPYRVEEVSGEIAIHPEGVSIIRAEGRHGSARISVIGDVRRQDDGGFAADLTLGCDAMPLDDDLYAAFPESLKSAWRAFNPSGIVQARTTLHCITRDGRLHTRHRTQLSIREGSARFEGLPLPVSDVAAELALSERRVEIHSMTGHVNGARIKLVGEVDIAAAQPSGVLSLTAIDLELGEALFNGLPANLGSALRAAQAVGHVDVRLDPLRFEPDKSGKLAWYFTGNLGLRDARMNLGLEVRDAVGLIKGTGQIDPRHGLSLDLSTALTKITLAGWPLENVAATLSQEAGSKALFVSDASAALYGGQVTGVAEITLGPGATQYQASITAHDLQLDQYLSASQVDVPESAHETDGAAGRGNGSDSSIRRHEVRATGDIYGNLIIRGRGGKDGYREGAGEVYVRSAQVWKLPLVFAILQVLNLTPDENVFHDGRLKFYLSRNTLTLQNIDLQGRAVSFVGGGSMDLGTRELDVTLLAGSPVRLRVPFLTDLLEGASREFMEVRVRGTVEKPTINPQPLKSLKEMLRTLFPLPAKPIRPQPFETATKDDENHG